MNKRKGTIEIISGTGLPDAPFELSCEGELQSNQVTGFIRDHISQIAADRNWQDLQIIDHHISSKKLSQLTAYEINYEAIEDGQLEYFSALFWYDITQPWTQIESQSSKIH